MVYDVEMKQIICQDCGTTPQQSKFYAGTTKRCAECHKVKVRENRALKSEYYRDYDAKRFQCDPKVKERHARYRQTDAGLASIRAAQHKWLASNKEKRQAHVALNNAVRDGRVTKPCNCTNCGKKSRIHGHHQDYSRAYDVIWLCQTCHFRLHAGHEK
jgi:hypothetical protein